MVDANSLIEGHCKFRDGKKWKTRWAVVTKLSPVADCLQLQIYRDEKERARNGHTKASLSLQAFLALESGFTLDKESHTLAIICQDLCVVLAFDNRERLIQWTVRIANNLGEGQQFLVQLASVPSKSKLTPGPVKLHVTDRKFCLTGGIPPRLLGHWEVPHLRRYGIVDGRLVFEGGSRCGKGEGVHVLVPDPPQISLIIDALDMSSKGQLLVRGSSRRFGSAVTDSPRKSLSRLSELRSSSICSTEPTSCLTPVAIPQANLAIASTMSPTPRESRSAEALCNACSDNIVSQQPGVTGGSMWMSSEASSRCDLDSCDNISVISPEDNVSLNPNEQSHLKHPASPARTPQQGQPLQIAKPLPSSMERCLSCMSKLGQQGQDILSPSWTMDLNVSATSSGASSLTTVPPPTLSSSSISSATNGSHAHHQSSIGSGNSDRLSISSHGSSGGVTEYYYDTPRSVLVAEARRNAAARASTPPGVSFHQNGQMSQANGNGGGVCPSSSSPYRNPRNNTNGFTGQQQGSSCPVGCHCHNHHQQAGRLMSSASSPNAIASVSHGNSPIYYNGVAEQKAHGGKPPINLHSSGVTATSSAVNPGPYENYDFPRCTHPISFQPQQQHSTTANHASCACCPAGEHHSSCHSGGIDWSKKPPMDRNSIASTSTQMGSDQASEFYDTPPRHASCACCNVSTAPPSCPCCVSGGGGGQTHLQHSHNGLAHSHYQNPACLMTHGGNGNDPMENYDIPPTHPGGIAIPAKEIIPGNGIARSVNGEGKMPLVSAGRGGVQTSAHAIYAQVDKTKKTSRPLMPHQQHLVNCDNQHYHHPQHHQPIYENHGSPSPPCHQQQMIQQPTYANMGETCKNHSGGVASTGLKGKPPAPEPQQNQPQSNSIQRLVMVGHQGGPHSNNPASNYVNLEYADSLILYENAQDIRQEPEGKPAGSDLVSSGSVVESSSHAESKSNVNDAKNPAATDEQLKSIPEEKEKEVISSSEMIVADSTKETENEYENTKVNSGGKELVKTASADSSDPPSVQEESSAISSDDNNIEQGAASTSNSKELEEERSLPLRRSSSVPCKGGHANRGSASSSDSGVSGDGGLFFDDSSPLNDIGSLCLHESLPRKGQRGSPTTTGKSTSTSTPKPQEEEQVEEITPSVENVSSTNANSDPSQEGIVDPQLLNRHYETIDESKGNCTVPMSSKESFTSSTVAATIHCQPLSNPMVTAVKSGEICHAQQQVHHNNQQQQRPKNPLTLVSDANSTSSGASDMSDYIETLSSCSRGSMDTVTSIPLNSNSPFGSNISTSSSVSPRKSTNMKPRSGKEYFKIDRSMFKND